MKKQILYYLIPALMIVGCGKKKTLEEYNGTIVNKHWDYRDENWVGPGGTSGKYNELVGEITIKSDKDSIYVLHIEEEIRYSNPYSHPKSYKILFPEFKKGDKVKFIPNRRFPNNKQKGYSYLKNPDNMFTKSQQFFTEINGVDIETFLQYHNQLEK